MAWVMKNEDIIMQAITRMGEAVDADKENREAALDDLEFLSGEQWPEDIKREREQANRPTPTINRLPRFVRQVTGDIRKLNPAIKVLAADSAATKNNAEIYAGLIRQIESQSDASSVYEGAAESAAQCGIGNFRILTEYESEASFNQEVRVERIHNPLSVYWDPAARLSTRADAEFCFITDQMDAKEFKKTYPDNSPVDAEHDGTTDGLQYWREAGEVVVAEYFWKEYVKGKIGLMPDGTVIDEPTAAHYTVKQRDVERVKVYWAKISGKDVLEGPTEIPCKYLPVVAVTGEEMDIGDRIVRTSVIRFAKDPQQIYNYYEAAQTEMIALQPKAPFLITAKQVSGLERFWADANTSNRAYLPYNPDDKAPPPQRMPPPIASRGMSEEMMRAEDDMKATTGIYDAALGGRSNEQSGIAIRQRQLESDISTSIYTDNLSKAIEWCGRIIVDMIPKVYDTKRILRIVGDDDQEEMVTVNDIQFMNDGSGSPVPQKINSLTEGKYDVRVTVGPNYSTRRQETSESMMQFVQAFPPAGQVAGDLIAKAMDWPDADKLAARLKKTLPPGIIPMNEMEPEEQDEFVRGLQQQIQQMQQQMQMMAQEPAFRKATAEAAEAEADAQKTTVEVQQAQVGVAQSQLELALQSGQINEMIGQIVQEQVIRVLQGTMQPGFAPQ